MYHKRDDRIRSHVFLCVLAYYVYWHMCQRLRPLFEKDGSSKDREWTMENVIEHLGGIRQQQVRVAGAEFEQITQPTEQQQQILDLLGIKNGVEESGKKSAPQGPLPLRNRPLLKPVH